MSRDNQQERKESHYMEKWRQNDQKTNVRKSHLTAPMSFLKFHCRDFFPSLNYQPCYLPIANDTTASLDKLTGTNYVELRKCQDRFGQLSCSKKNSNYLDVRLPLFERDDKRDFRLVQILTTREANFNQFLKMRKQLDVAAQNFGNLKKICPHYWYQQRPKTGMSISNWLRRRLP